MFAGMWLQAITVENYILRGSALAAAALVAPALSFIIVLVILSVADGTLPTAYDVMGGLLIAVLFGFVGAFLFLSVGLSLVRRPQHQNYAIAGGATGLAHSIVGYTMHFLYDVLPPGDLESLVGWTVLLGGFLLTAGREVAVISAFVATPVAGIAAGYLYALLMRDSRKVVADD